MLLRRTSFLLELSVAVPLQIHPYLLGITRRNCALLRCYIVRISSLKIHSFSAPSILGFSQLLRAAVLPCFTTLQSRFSKGVSEFKNKTSKREDNKTPMEMLRAQDRSIEMGTRQDPPNLVAKLMGLEALPLQKAGSSVRRNHSTGDPRNCSVVPMSCWEQKGGFFQYVDPNEHKVDCEIWQRSQKSPHAARYEETIDGRKMGLVRQKFIEAKRLSVNEKHRQSKQFQDALEVMCSNKDLFLKCLQESHSTFSKNLYSRQCDAHPAETKRITILRPSKRVESNEFVEAGNKGAKKMKNGAFLRLKELEKVQQGSSSPESSKHYNNSSPSTQIVVLRPACKKGCDNIAVPYPHTEQPMMLRREDFFRHIEDEEDQESREVAKEFAQQMHEIFGQPCKVENLISSLLLNGHAGDVSSSDKLEDEHVEAHLCDSEITLPVSSHSRDYVDRFRPYSTSPFTLSSDTPESSVCREAKKRLSERWAMVAPNEVVEERIRYHKSSSTLGEMLALPETKPVSSHGEEGTSHQESDSNFLLCSEGKGEEKIDYSTRNLMRSKSVPVSGGFGTRMNIGSSISEKGKPESVKENTLASSAKSSLREKISSFFFSRAKTPDKEKSTVSTTEDEFHLSPRNTDRTGILGDEESIHPSFLLEQSKEVSSSNPICRKMISREHELVMEKPTTSGKPGENLNQPSPISVLGPPFEEDEYIQKTAAYDTLPEQQGVESPLLFIGSHLIDKSPPIGSIARTSSCNDSDSSHPPKRFITKETDEEEHECFIIVKALLSEARLHSEAHPTSSLMRWNSLESPLDPSLRGKSIDFEDEKKWHDSKLRQKTAVQILVYDCVNSALVDARTRGNNSTPSTILDEVWSNIKVWLSSEVRGMVDDSGENDSLVVEKVIGKELDGKGWSHPFRSEIDNLGKEIEERLLEELTHEMVVALKASK